MGLEPREKAYCLLSNRSQNKRLPKSYHLQSKQYQRILYHWKKVRTIFLNKNYHVFFSYRYLLFWSWERNVAGFEFYSSLAQKKEMTQTVFIPGSAQAVTGTQDGHIIVWDISLIMVISIGENKRNNFEFYLF